MKISKIMVLAVMFTAQSLMAGEYYGYVKVDVRQDGANDVILTSVTKTATMQKDYNSAYLDAAAAYVTAFDDARDALVRKMNLNYNNGSTLTLITSYVDELILNSSQDIPPKTAKMTLDGYDTAYILDYTYTAKLNTQISGRGKSECSDNTSIGRNTQDELFATWDNYIRDVKANDTEIERTIDQAEATPAQLPMLKTKCRTLLQRNSASSSFILKAVQQILQSKGNERLNLAQAFQDICAAVTQYNMACESLEQDVSGESLGQVKASFEAAKASFADFVQQISG
ncbi:MAG: hypothetical protein PHW04_15670 [Candidatus Wallbacteria bacterium]|nr:hypothetical protein [Candidatus Wallbacteria bacterium]